MGELGLSNDMRVRHWLCIIAPESLIVVSGARLALHDWMSTQFGHCGCLQLRYEVDIEHRSNLHNMLHMFTYTPCKRELDACSSNFRANSSDR